MSGNNWRGWAVSVTGPSHILNNIPNQDACIVKKFSWGTVGVVCDGLGSKKYSHIGSRALVDAVVETSKIFDFEKDITLFEPLLKALWFMNIAPYSQEETSTTLLFVIVKNKKVYVGRVGDGAIVLFGKNALLNEEDKTAFTNLTVPFGRSEKITWKVYAESDIDYIVMCSDGVSEDIKRDKLFNFFQTYVENYKDMSPWKRSAEIRSWLKNWPVRGHSDDKTIVTLLKGRE